ncbi:MAG: DUF362 domain-containing protein [Desulfobacter sp.]
MKINSSPDSKWKESRLNRREFLKTQLKGAMWMAAGASGILMPKPVIASALPDVGVAKGAPGPATRAVVELIGGMKTFVKKGSRVVIKPNMSFNHTPEEATTTHPEVVKELVAMCLEAGASRVRVLDNPFTQTLAAKNTEKVCSVIKKGMVHAIVDSSFYKPVEITTGRKFKNTDVMQDVLEADVLIAAPVAKSHSSTGVSLSIKGMMGLIWDRETMHRDYDLSQAIVDLSSLLKPQLAIVDATRVLTTNGPFGPGKVVKMDTVVASGDMVAADAKTVQMCKWYGRRFAPRQIKHIRYAHEQGLGRMDIENLSVKRIDV